MYPAFMKVLASRNAGANAVSNRGLHESQTLRASEEPGDKVRAPLLRELRKLQ
jgi:hypothetical protein